MISLIQKGYLCVLGITMLASAACDSADSGAGNGDTGGDPELVFGDDYVFSCGNANCKTDLDKATALLKEGKFQEAYDEYECADTPQAAFGAAFSQMILMLENDAVTKVLGRAGYSALSANEFIGPGGLVYRNGQYYDGTGSFNLTGTGVEIPFDFDVVHSDMDEEQWRIEGDREGVVPDYSLWFEGSPEIALSKGDIIEIGYDCDAETPYIPSPLVNNLWVDVSVKTEENWSYYCNLITTWIPSGLECPNRTGSISIEEMGAMGEPVVYQFTDVAMYCSHEYYSGDDEDTQPTENFVAYLNGTVESRLTEWVTDDLHPFIQDPEAVWEDLPSSYTAAEAVKDAAPLVDNFETIACFAASAGESGADQVFEIPQELLGRPAVSVSAADADILAAGFLFNAASVRIAESYDSDMHLRAMYDMSNEKIVDEINNNLPVLKPQQKFDEARSLITKGLVLVAEGLERMDDKGIAVLDNYTEEGRNHLLEWTNAALDSLADGETVVPYSDPAITFNLQKLFTDPPDPSKIDADAVVLECNEDEYDNYCYVEAVEVFFHDLVGDTILNFDFDMEDNDLFYNPEDIMEDFAESLFGHTCSLVGCS